MPRKERGSQLADNDIKIPIVPLVTGPRRGRAPDADASGENFVKPKQFPANRLLANATPQSLPDSHHRSILLGKADCMNFHRSGPAVISKLKALLLLKA